MADDELDALRWKLAEALYDFHGPEAGVNSSEFYEAQRQSEDVLLQRYCCVSGHCEHNKLEEIEFRWASVPHGPWSWTSNSKGYPQTVTNPQALVIAQTFIGPEHYPYETDFIANSHADVRWLLDEVARLGPSA